jgi:hypothetical protein
MNGKTSDEEAIFLLASEQNMRGEGVKNFVASFVEAKFWGFSQKLIVLIVFEHFIKF